MSDSLLAEAHVAVGFDSTALKSGIASSKSWISRELGSLGTQAGNAFSFAFKASVAGGLAALAGGGLLAGLSVKLGSDAEEAGSKFGFVFGDAAGKAGNALDDFASRAGRSRFELRAMAGDIGALLGPMGFTADRTAEMSVQFAKLATDLSSFFNVTEADALTALRAGIVGESEPLRRLGVQLNEAKIQDEAFRLGLAKTKDQVTGAIKAEAILSIVMRETAAAQGDAERTSGSYANQLRALQGTLKDVGTEAGAIFIPAANAINGALRRGVESLKGNSEEFKRWGDQLANITHNVIEAFTGLNGFKFNDLTSTLSELLSFTELFTADLQISFDYLVDGIAKSLIDIDSNVAKAQERLSQGAQQVSFGVDEALIYVLENIVDGNKEYTRAWKEQLEQLRKEASQPSNELQTRLSNNEAAKAFLDSSMQARADRLNELRNKRQQEREAKNSPSPAGPDANAFDFGGFLSGVGGSLAGALQSAFTSTNFGQTKIDPLKMLRDAPVADASKWLAGLFGDLGGLAGGIAGGIGGLATNEKRQKFGFADAEGLNKSVQSRLFAAFNDPQKQTADNTAKIADSSKKLVEKFGELATKLNMGYGA